MGQKTHPIGLRVGIHRKWNTTWFSEGSAYKSSFFAQYQVEQFFKSFFYFYSATKNSWIKRVWLVDLKWFRSGVSQLYIFIFFYKFRTKKRKPNIRRNLKIWTSFKDKLKIKFNKNKKFIKKGNNLHFDKNVNKKNWIK